MAAPTDWYDNKENIKPIPEGRLSSEVISLGSNITPLTLDQEIAEFERNIENSDDSNIIENWFRYIYWAEQKHIASGKIVYKLLERCIKSIGMNPVYFNNEVYLIIWQKYAKLSEKQLDIYHFMFTNNIGTEYVSFYKDWAHAMEINGFYSKAKEIFKLGIHRNILDGDKLLIYLNALNERIKSNSLTDNDQEQSNIIENRTIVNNTNANIQEVRKVFNNLVSNNQYDEAMDRVYNSERAQPYGPKNNGQYENRNISKNHRSLASSQVYKDLNQNQVYDALPNSSAPERQEVVPDSLKETWSKPFIISDVDSGNITKVTENISLPKNNINSASREIASPYLSHSSLNNASSSFNSRPTSILCDNRQNDKETKRTSNTVSVNDVFLEIAPHFSLFGDDSTINFSNTFDNNPPNKKLRRFSFKFSKMPEDVKNFLEKNATISDNSNIKSKIFYIISPEMDYIGQENEYSFEELLAAKYKKYKRSTR